MAANLRLYTIKGGTYFLLEESLLNVVGTPLISVAKAGNGLQRSGLWTLAFNTVVPGVSAVCVVTCDAPHDPSISTGVAVALDGTTVHKGVIEGLGLVFSSSGSFNSSWTGKVYYGEFHDVADNSDNATLNAGIVVAGASSSAKRIACRNDGGDQAASCTVRVVNGVRNVPLSGTPIVSIDYTDVSQAPNMSPGYLMTFANKVTGPPATIDVLIDGGTFDIQRLDTGDVFPGGAGVPMDGTTVLLFLSGSLAGLRFVLASSTANTDQERLYVSDGARLWKIAPDLGGSPGTYQPATTALQLTEDGGSTPGQLLPSNTAFFWTQLVTLGTDSPVGNERFTRFIVEGLGV